MLTAAAGAIRTDTAYPRFLTAAHAAGALVAPAGPGVTGYWQASAVTVAALVALPAARRVAALPAMVTLRTE